MNILRTPDERFAALPEFAFAANYREASVDGTALRTHYLDEGEGTRGVILMVHPQQRRLHQKF